MLVQPTGAGQDTNVSGGRTKGEINLDTEAQLVRSTAVAADAAKLLRSTTGPPDALAARRLGRGAGEHRGPGDHVPGARRPRRAGRIARVRRGVPAQPRGDRAPTTWPSRSPRVDGKLKQLNAALAPINARLATVRPDSPERPNLESQRSTITAQVNTLSGRLNQLVTTTVSAGKIIRDANLPNRPSKPVLPLNLGSGAAVGLLLGVGAALLRERLDRRIRRPADMTRRCDVAGAGGAAAEGPPAPRRRVPAVRRRRPGVQPAAQRGAGRRADAGLAPQRPADRGNGQVIVVAGASRGVGVDRGRGEPGRRVRPHRGPDRAGLRAPAGQRRPNSRR